MLGGVWRDDESEASEVEEEEIEVEELRVPALAWAPLEPLFLADDDDEAERSACLTDYAGSSADSTSLALMQRAVREAPPRVEGAAAESCSELQTLQHLGFGHLWGLEGLRLRASLEGVRLQGSPRACTSGFGAGQPWETRPSELQIPGDASRPSSAEISPSDPRHERHRCPGVRRRRAMRSPDDEDGVCVRLPGVNSPPGNNWRRRPWHTAR